MANKDGRFFEMLESDVTCEKKTINDGVDDRPIHNHDGYEVIFMLDGNAVVNTDIDKRKIDGGDMVIVKSGTYHHGEPDNSRIYDRVIINVKESWARSLVERKPELANVFKKGDYDSAWICHLNSTQADEFLKCSEELEEVLKEDDYGVDVLVKAFLSKMLVFVNRLPGEEIGSIEATTNAQKQQLVQMLQAFIDLNISEDLTLASLEKLFMYSGPYLSKCFKEATDMSIQNYIIKKRICLAKSFISKGMDLKTVCSSTGFGNYSNFSRTFMQYTGINPKSYQMTLGK